MSKGLADKGDHKQKGVVIKVIDNYVGEINVLDSKHVLKVDQEELETVIPQIGGLVRIVNGAAYRDQMRGHCQLTQITTVLKVDKGIYDGHTLQAVDYEDICKITQRASGRCSSHHLIKSGDWGQFGSCFFNQLLGWQPFLLKYSLSQFSHSQKIIDGSVML